MAEAKTVRLKLTVCQSGSNFVRNTGDTYEADEGEAERMLAAGFAVLADDAPPAAATPPPPTDPPPPKPRRGRPTAATTPPPPTDPPAS